MWTKQIHGSLSWILAFIQRQQGTVTRLFTYDSCFGITAPIEITTDASIWGIGGWIAVAGTPIAYFTQAIATHDETVLGHKRGEHEGQQAFEALALLVAIRLWAPLWKHKRVRLIIRNDNVGALTVFAACKGKSIPMNAVAREYALDLADGTHEPDLIQHLPGITNAVADALSRRTDPAYEKNWVTPTHLKHAKRVEPLERGPSWWKARVTPGVSANAQKGGDDNTRHASVGTTVRSRTVTRGCQS